MTDFEIQEFDDYDEFVQEWYTEKLDVPLDEARNRSLINEDKARLLWQLLGQLENDELLIQIPQWLADQKVGFIDGTTPTEFVGRIDRETEKAILFIDSASAQSLTKLAHRIHQLESSIEDTDDDDRHKWMADRLQNVRERFESRDNATVLSERVATEKPNSARCPTALTDQKDLSGVGNRFPTGLGCMNPRSGCRRLHPLQDQWPF